MPEAKPEGPPAASPQSGSDLARLLSLTVHELRTPSSVVAGYLKMLRAGRHGALPDNVGRIVDAADRSCERVLELVAEIGELCHLIDGRARFTRSDVAFAPLVDEVTAACAAARDREVRRVGDAGPHVIVRADRQRLAGVVDTMLTTVIREIAGDAPVAVHVTAGPDRLTLIVADGRARLDRFLAPAARGPLEEWRGGLGLRLPIARRTAELEGGGLWSPARPDDPSLIGLDLPRAG